MKWLLLSECNDDHHRRCRHLRRHRSSSIPAAPGQKVISKPIYTHNDHIKNDNLNAAKLVPLQSKNASSLDNLKFKAVDLQRQQDDRQANAVVQQQHQPQKKEDWPPSNNQGVPPPLQPSQEYQGRMKNWENPPPPPPLTSEQKNFWLPADQQNTGWQDQAKKASASWHQNWNQDLTQQRQTQPAPDPWVDRESRKGVEWNYNANYYSLKASSDSRFLIRYSPPPSPGSPWPMPQVGLSSNIVRVVAVILSVVKVVIVVVRSCRHTSRPQWCCP